MNNKFRKLLVAFLLITFCNSFSYAQDKKFSLGIIVPLSGPLAEYGTSIRNGFELAKSKKTELFTNLNFEYEDSGYDANTAINALNNLSQTKNINLYYMWGVTPTEAMLPIAVKNNWPVIAETTIKEATVGKKFVIRAARTGERIAKALSQEIKNRKLKRITLMLAQIPFYVDISKYLASDLKANGIELKIQEVLPTEIDFKTKISIIKQKQDDAIGLFLLPAQLINFYKQLDHLKLNVQTFNADLLDSSSILRDCPKTIENAFFTQVGVTEEFRRSYLQFAKSDVHVGSAAQSYDVALLVGELFGMANGSIPPDEVIKILSKVSMRNGATGRFTFTEMPDSGKEFRMPVSLKTIKQHKIETLVDDTGF